MNERMMRISRVALPVVTMLLMCLLTAGGCGSSEKGERPEGRENESTQARSESEEERVEQDQHPVTLKLYFMGESGGDLYLGVEERVVPPTSAVARAAMEELIRGPSAGSGLRAVLPPTVRVLGVSVENGVCTVDLSREIITDKAAAGGAGAEAEALALTSIADTLTEFPTVQRVRLLVEGRQKGVIDGLFIEDFWGHVGLPEFLERDLSEVRPR